VSIPVVLGTQPYHIEWSTVVRMMSVRITCLAFRNCADRPGDESTIANSISHDHVGSSSFLIGKDVTRYCSSFGLLTLFGLYVFCLGLLPIFSFVPFTIKLLIVIEVLLAIGPYGFTNAILAFVPIRGVVMRGVVKLPANLTLPLLN
jgi:hypothetical protein